MNPTGATREATGHSPLPWLVPDSDFEKVCTGDGLIIADTYDRRRPDLSLPKPVREANAQLIVTAVNERERLRDVLQSIVDEIDDAVDRKIRKGRLPPIGALLSTIQDSARAALNEVEG